MVAILGCVLWTTLNSNRALAVPANSKAVEPAYVLKPKGTLTFAKDIAPIVFQNCSDCHRPGEVAPFPLLNYEDVRKKAKTIVKVVDKRFMPPWKAEAGLQAYHDERRLSGDQIGMIKQWVEEGMKEGEAAQLPPLPKFVAGWGLGEPDVVFSLDEPYQLAAEGRDVYQCFVIPTHFTEDKYVSAVEVRPENRAVVHHAIVYTDTTGNARRLDEAQPGPGYTTFGGVGFIGAQWLEGWAPGNRPRPLPAGTGILIPKGADLILQVHYHKSGKPETDRTKFGIYFAKGSVTQRVRISQLAYHRLQIQPGDSNYVVQASLPVPANVHVLAVMPHMHLLGREMTVTATLPDGQTEPLVHVPDWDFNWQLSYNFKEPLKLARGSKVMMEARYDNSAQNPNNPSNPPRPVRWGEQTTDEMCIAFLVYTVDGEDLTKGVSKEGIPRRPAGAGNGALLQLLRQRLAAGNSDNANGASSAAPADSAKPVNPASGK